MTCIAYRSGIIAADTMVIHDDHVKLLNDRKIIKKHSHLIGMAGDNCPSIEQAAKWFFLKEKKPMAHHSFILLVVTPDKVIYIWDEKTTHEKIDVPFYAIGSGKEYAIGAMEAGATAMEAVEVAIKWCPTVGGKVLVRKF